MSERTVAQRMLDAAERLCDGLWPARNSVAQCSSRGSMLLRLIAGNPPIESTLAFLTRLAAMREERSG